MKLYFTFLILLSPLILVAQRRDQNMPLTGSSYFGIQFDDDFLFIGNRDEQYTGGMEFEFLRQLQEKKGKRGLFNPFSHGQRTFSSAIGSYLHTPYNVSDSSIILNDRPFSSYMYIEMGYLAYSQDRRQRFSMELYLGMMGAELPGKIQEAVHTIGDSPPANGWQNRIAQRKRFIPNLKLNYQNTLFNTGGFDVLGFHWLQLRSIWELQGGLYFNGLSGGLMILADNQKPDEQGQFAPPFIKTGNDDRHPKCRIRPFFSGELQLVAHNTGLQSLPWMNSPYIIETPIMNRAVWVLEGGIMLTKGRFHAAYKVQSRSKEFKKYIPDWHTWAGMTIGWAF